MFDKDQQSSNLKLPSLRGVEVRGVEPSQDMCLASRETAKGMLKGIIARRESELRNLKGLHAALPESMGPGADEALWAILCSYR